MEPTKVLLLQSGPIVVVSSLECPGSCRASPKQCRVMPYLREMEYVGCGGGEGDLASYRPKPKCPEVGMPKISVLGSPFVNEKVNGHLPLHIGTAGYN